MGQKTKKITRKQKQERDRLLRLELAVKEMRQPPLKSAWTRLANIPKKAYALIGFVATLLAFLTLYPWLSIEQNGQLRKNDPFSAVFTVSNEGFLPLTDIAVVCSLDVDIRGVGQARDLATHQEHYAELLSFMHKLSLPCFQMSFSQGPLQNVRLRAILSYNVWHLPIRRTQSFSLIGIPDDLGEWHWIYKD